jgi:hypothetical protein
MMVECVGIRVYEGRMRPYWTKTALLLALLWGVIGGAIWIVRKNRATPERIAEFVGANTLEGKAPADRAKLIEEVAKRVNSLEYEQRREMDKQRKLEKFWLALTAEEKERYLDRVLPSGFKQMMESFNKMEPGKRRKMVQKAVDDLREHGGDRERRDANDPAFRKIIDQGLKSFFSDATIDAKMDALTFLEALEQTVKWSR